MKFYEIERNKSRNCDKREIKVDFSPRLSIEMKNLRCSHKERTLSAEPSYAIS